MRPRTRWLLLLSIAVLLFFWKIVFTRQFSLLLDHEGANVAYAWDHYASATVKQGIPPLWDPHTFSGHTFIGEMQTGVFYPLKLILYLLPLDRSGLLAPQHLHWLFVLAHVLAAWFMFLLAEELGLAGFPAFTAACCFTFSGFVGRIGWPYMLDAAIWLPLIFVFLLRALGADGGAPRTWNACMAGLLSGLPILAGSLHIAMMNALVILSAAVFFAFRGISEREDAPGRSWRPRLARCAGIVAIVGVVTFATGAIQLFPSMEYAQLALRYYGPDSPPLPATERIPYAYVGHALAPRAFFALIFPTDHGGEISPHFGAVPLLLVLIGVWRNWDRPWVRYLSGLAVVAFFYSLGAFSFLHGVVYGLVPYIWMIWEAGRFIYLTHFAMAVLAGFGARTLFLTEENGSLIALGRSLKWMVIALALALGVPALYGKPQVNEWIYFSFLFIVGAYFLYVWITAGRSTGTARFLLVALILCEMSPFQWGIVSRIERQRSGKDHLQELHASRDLANFLRAQPGPFRVQMAMDGPPNIGDTYGIGTVGGAAVTMLGDYEKFISKVPRANDLLNVRYIVRRASATEPGPVYQDERWKVYESPSHLPRAWVVHQVVNAASSDDLLRRVAHAEFQPREQAVVTVPLEAELDAGANGRAADVVLAAYRPNRIELEVRSPGRGLLVLSEIHYPGWKATLNGQPVKIHKVNGLLRGVVVPAGQSRLSFGYAPLSVFAGAVLTLSAVLGTLALGALLLAGRKRPPSSQQGSS